MERKIYIETLIIKGSIVSLVSFLSTKIGLTKDWMVILLISMILDYITGLTVAAINGELNSRKGILGILKKVGYIILIGVSLIVDWLMLNIGGTLGISTGIDCAITILILSWLILNELLSILENIGNAGVPIPESFKKLLKTFKEKTNIDSKNN